MIEEEWKEIIGIDGYLVSSLGKIKSIDRWIKSEKCKADRWRKGVVLKGCFDKDGYRQIYFGKIHPNGLSRKVHRIVMATFHGPSDLEVNHKDGNKTNNELSNLEYSTHSENHIHCRRVLKKLVGENHWNYKHGLSCE